MSPQAIALARHHNATSTAMGRARALLEAHGIKTTPAPAPRALATLEEPVNPKGVA